MGQGRPYTYQQLVVLQTLGCLIACEARDQRVCDIRSGDVFARMHNTTSRSVERRQPIAPLLSRSRAENHPTLRTQSSLQQRAANATKRQLYHCMEEAGGVTEEVQSSYQKLHVRVGVLTKDYVTAPGHGQ